MHLEIVVWQKRGLLESEMVMLGEGFMESNVYTG